MKISLKGKKVVLTGGAMGIGLSTARRLIKEGCDVTIWDFNEVELKKAVAELTGTGAEVFGHVCDVSDKNRVRKLADTARKEMGQIDILINNAGYVRHGMFWKQPVEAATRQIEVNVNAQIYAIHEFLPEMLNRNSGHIVNVSSGVAICSVPGLAAYTTSKWAVWGLTDVLRLEVTAAGKTKVQLTSVHPGNIVSGLFQGFSLNRLGKLLFPPISDHDVIARGIVEKGLKRGKPLVVLPKRLYLGMILRGLIPSRLLVKLTLLAGGAGAVSNYTGRKGMRHSNDFREKITE